MVLRFIGEATTDANGLAVLSDGYVGTGAGEVDIIAKTVIDDSTLQSEIYEVLDCYLKDNGTTDTNIWTVGSATLNRNVNNEYSVLTETTVGTTGIMAISNISLTNYRIEFDVYQVDGTGNEWCVSILNNDYSQISGLSADGKLGEWKHISLDAVDVPTNTRVRIVTGNSCTTLRVKNFKLYPI